jgi:DNA modification methylase
MQKYRILKTGVDAFDFVKTIPYDIWPLIDTVVWDPPYSDEGGHYDRQYKKEYNTYERHAFNLTKNKEKLVMNRHLRLNILNVILKKICRPYTLFHFFGNIDTSKQPLDIKCDNIIIWHKSNIDYKNKFSLNNHEFIHIKNNKKNLHKHLKYIWSIPTEKDGFKWSKRIAAKPLKLFQGLFEHYESKFVLDLFAGYGNSIRACDQLGLNIIACDLDKELNWDKKKKISDYL